MPNQKVTPLTGMKASPGRKKERTMFGFREPCLLDIRQILSENVPYEYEELDLERHDLFQFKFENGNVLSVGVGEGHYVDHAKCECAVFGPGHEFIPISEHDDVRGYVGESELIELARQVATDTIPEFQGLKSSWSDVDEDEE